MRFKRRRSIEKGRLDMTPLVDVVFLLLIFFMLSSSFITQPGIKVDLPQADTSALSYSGDVIITLDEDNKLFFNKERTAFDGLERRIKRFINKNPDASFIIKADVKASHGKVVDILSIAQKSGIHKIAVAANEKQN